MAAPNISASDRFIPEGTTAYYWVVTYGHLHGAVTG